MSLTLCFKAWWKLPIHHLIWAIECPHVTQIVVEPKNLSPIPAQICKQSQQNKRVCHIVALPFTLLQSILRQKEDLWKFKYFTITKIYILQKNPLTKTNQNPSRNYYNNSIITNLKFQHKFQNIIFQKILIEKLDLLFIT